MSGIAGIISLNRNLIITDNDFTRFFSCILTNKCKVSIQQIIINAGFVGLGELEGLTPKFYYSEVKDTQVFIWGDFFLAKSLNSNSGICKEERIFNLWDAGEKELINNITGDFVMFIADHKSNRLVLFNSCFGMMPLYVLIKDQVLFFSSRLQSFIDIGTLNCKINHSALLQYLIFGYAIDSQSFLENIILLEAATIISNKKGKWIPEKYDSHSYLLAQPTYNFKDGTDLVNESFSNAITDLSNLRPSFGCSITGGWDGRLLLSYLMKKDDKDYFLYTYGKKTQADLSIATRLAQKFRLRHIPIDLDDCYIDDYEELSSESILLSDGLKGPNRGHYILMAKVLSKVTNLVLSGNCGSNILKIVQSSSGVYNSYLLKLFSTNLPIEEKANSLYKDFFEKNPWVKEIAGVDEFVAAVKNCEILQDYSLTQGQKFYHYLLTNIERKYFGAEAATYSSYIYNYSPFINSDFVKDLVQTPFFGGHYPFLESNPVVRLQLSKLYAGLLLANHEGLAKFTSDRGFPVTWFLTPLGCVAGYAKKRMRSIFEKTKDPDPFNHKKGIKTKLYDWHYSEDFFKKPDRDVLSDEKIRAMTLSYWIKNAL